MAIGKSGIPINFDKLSIKIGDINIIQNGKINISYNEQDASEYMKNFKIDIQVDISKGSKKFYCIYNGFNKIY